MAQGIIMFAEAGNNSDIITWGIILTLTTVAANIVAVVLAFSNRKQKREINWAFEPASKEEFDKHVEFNKREHDGLFSKIGGVERGGNGQADKLRDLIREEVGGVHERVNEVDKGLAALNASTRIQNDELTEMKRDIKTLLQRKS